MNLSNELQTAFKPVLKALTSESDIEQWHFDAYLHHLKPTSDPKHGDFQANFAMPIAKLLSKKAPELAKEIVDKLPAHPMIATVSVAGPGFINIKLSDVWIAQQLNRIAKDERLGVAKVEKPSKYVIDYSGPNVAKPLHVGHLRSTIIGDALVRILRFMGHNVVGDNHLGDWGTQFGMLIYGYRTFLDKKAWAGNDADKVRELARLYVMVRNVAKTIDIISNGFTNYLDKEAFDSNPIDELARIYVNGLKRAKASEDDEGDESKGAPFHNPIADAYRKETAKLHAGDTENKLLWSQFMVPCLAAIHLVYEKLDILPIDNELGESFYHSMLSSVVSDLLKSGIAHESKGAVVIPNANGKIPQTPEELSTEEPPALIRKRDGAFTYTTTDLATIQYRLKEWQPNVILYVVDARQALHFKTIFTNAKLSSVSDVELIHVQFGSILGKDGKPFKTRDGGTVELDDLVERAIILGTKLAEKTLAQRFNKQQVDGAEAAEIKSQLKEISRVVGIGAVKYADLSSNRLNDYVFDEEKMTSTEGNTATYMQYAYARCRAIFRKGNLDEVAFRSAPPSVQLTHAAERALGLQLLKFEEVLTATATEYLPHYITQYLWDVAKAFSGFYEACKVVDEANPPEVQSSRLLLVDLTARIIRQSLELLGIRTVERM